MIFKTTKRIDKNKITRITIPPLVMKLLDLKEGDELACSADYKTQTLYYHHSTFRGSLKFRQGYYKIIKSCSYMIVVPAEYYTILTGATPWVTVTIDPDTWDFRVTPEEKACNHGDV